MADIDWNSYGLDEDGHYDVSRDNHAKRVKRDWTAETFSNNYIEHKPRVAFGVQQQVTTPIVQPVLATHQTTVNGHHDQKILKRIAEIQANNRIKPDLPVREVDKCARTGQYCIMVHRRRYQNVQGRSARATRPEIPVTHSAMGCTKDELESGDVIPMGVAKYPSTRAGGPDDQRQHADQLALTAAGLVSIPLVTSADQILIGQCLRLAMPETITDATTGTKLARVAVRGQHTLDFSFALEPIEFGKDGSSSFLRNFLSMLGEQHDYAAFNEKYDACQQLLDMQSILLRGAPGSIGVLEQWSNDNPGLSAEQKQQFWENQAKVLRMEDTELVNGETDPKRADIEQHLIDTLLNHCAGQVDRAFIHAEVDRHMCQSLEIEHMLGRNPIAQSNSDARTQFVQNALVHLSSVLLAHIQDHHNRIVHHLQCAVATCSATRGGELEAYWTNRGMV